MENCFTVLSSIFDAYNKLDSGNRIHKIEFFKAFQLAGRYFHRINKLEKSVSYTLNALLVFEESANSFMRIFGSNMTTYKIEILLDSSISIINFCHEQILFNKFKVEDLFSFLKKATVFASKAIDIIGPNPTKPDEHLSKSLAYICMAKVYAFIWLIKREMNLDPNAYLIRENSKLFLDHASKLIYQLSSYEQHDSAVKYLYEISCVYNLLEDVSQSLLYLNKLIRINRLNLICLNESVFSGVYDSKSVCVNIMLLIKNAKTACIYQMVCQSCCTMTNDHEMIVFNLKMLNEFFVSNEVLLRQLNENFDLKKMITLINLYQLRSGLKIFLNRFCKTDNHERHTVHSLFSDITDAYYFRLADCLIIRFFDDVDTNIFTLEDILLFKGILASLSFREKSILDIHFYGESKFDNNNSFEKIIDSLQN